MAPRFAVTWTKSLTLIEGGRFSEPFELVDENRDPYSLDGLTIKVRIGTSLETPALVEATNGSGIVVRTQSGDDVGKADMDFSISTLTPGAYLFELTLFEAGVPFAYARGPVDVIKTMPGVAS